MNNAIQKAIQTSIAADATVAFDFREAGMTRQDAYEELNQACDWSNEERGSIEFGGRDADRQDWRISI